MNAIEFLNNLVRRPNPTISAPPPPAGAAKAKGRAPAIEAPEMRPVTLDEIQEGLRACFKLRQEIEEAKDAFEAEHDKAIDDGDEVALAELDERERGLTNQLKIINKRELEISARLREVKAVEKSRRFEVVKAELIGASEEFLPALVAAVRAHDKYRAVRSRVVHEFNSANDFLPGEFSLTDGDIQTFTADIARLRTVVRGVVPQPISTSIESMIEHAHETGKMPELVSPASADVRRAFDRLVTIVITKAVRDANGLPVKAGAEIAMPYPHAMALVKRNVARVKE